ncbi:folate-binding protein YgfZ [Microbacterium sediminicola]|uniref:Folate-binding protein YgfZ n=1 Tax=Microbacterium sediminicola TaxID=415210 RepID=A0ABP4U3N2_9MICO
MADSRFASVSGAVVDDTVGGVLHFGNPLVEQRLLAQGRALAPREDRAVIAVGGEDRLTWLDSLTSQALARLEPGVSTELLVLDPHGHIEHAAAVLDDGVTTWLIADTVDTGALAGWLNRMRFRMRVEVREASELSVFAGTAAATAAVAAAAPNGIPVAWTDPWPRVAVGGHGYALAEHPGAERDWVEVIVDEPERERILGAAVAGDLSLAGRYAAEALRIAAWRPSLAADVNERSLPHELDWMRTAVHLSKGCYRGQETVAKVHNLGHPPRRIVAVHLDGSSSVLPGAGSEIRAGDAVVGVLTSVALHYEDGPIGLAIVRRGAPDGDVLVDAPDGPVAASLEQIVPADAGAAASVPRITRLSRRTVAEPPTR